MEDSRRSPPVTLADFSSARVPDTGLTITPGLTTGNRASYADMSNALQEREYNQYVATYVEDSSQPGHLVQFVTYGPNPDFNSLAMTRTSARPVANPLTGIRAGIAYIRALYDHGTLNERRILESEYYWLTLPLPTLINHEAEVIQHVFPFYRDMFRFMTNAERNERLASSSQKDPPE